MTAGAGNSPTGVLRAVFSLRMLAQVVGGFASGLPLLLTGSTMQAWMVDLEVDLKTIGLFSLVGMPYTLKFLWAPLFDRFVPPFLGRRRGWLLVVQVLLMVLVAGLGLSDPVHAPACFVVLALLVSFTSASQDVVLDAYRREALGDAELGLGSSLFVNGYRLGMLVSGALALLLSAHLSWPVVYLLMALCLGLGVLNTLACQEPETGAPPPSSLCQAVVEPVAEFFRRGGALPILLFILLFKLGDQVAISMTTPFILAAGFSKEELAWYVNVFGLWTLIAGGFLGGVLMLGLGIRRSLWIFGVLQMLGILGYALLAARGRSGPLLALAVAAENLTLGLGTSAFTAWMASLTDRRFTATQYALFSSVAGIPRVLVAAPAGYLATALGWPLFFVCCTLLAVPGLLLLPFVARKAPAP